MQAIAAYLVFIWAGYRCLEFEPKGRVPKNRKFYNKEGGNKWVILKNNKKWIKTLSHYHLIYEYCYYSFFTS